MHSASWPRHDGTPTGADADLLVAPHPSIGPVLSAETNRARDGFYPLEAESRRSLQQVTLLGLLTGWALGAAAWVSPLTDPADLLPWSSALDWTGRWVALGAGVLAAIASRLAARALRRKRSSYVGKLGLQVYEKGLLGGRTRVVRFADCAQLKVYATRQFYAGAYQGTFFRYGFFDARNRPAFLIKGHFLQRDRPSDAFRFALAAEKAWNARPGPRPAGR
jgi:hypothetical protein